VFPLKPCLLSRFLAAVEGFLFVVSPSVGLAALQADAPSAWKDPPVIILKLDDLSQKEEKILPAFLKMQKILEDRNIITPSEFAATRKK